MFIRKKTSKVVHGAYGLDLTRPTFCQQSGWSEVWVKVSEDEAKEIRKNRKHKCRFCKKCFPNGVYGL